MSTISAINKIDNKMVLSATDAKLIIQTMMLIRDHLETPQLCLNDRESEEISRLVDLSIKKILLI